MRNLKKKTIKRILKLFLLGTVFLMLCTSNTANAQGFETSNYSIAINISEDGSARFKIARTIENNDDLDLINGYEYVFPSEVPDQIYATLNDHELRYEVIGSYQNYSKVHFYFDNVVKPGESKDLEITATVNDFMKNIGQLQYFTILASSDEKVDLTITFPLSFEEPRLITAENFNLISNGNSYQLTLFQPDSLLVLWPNAYSVNIQNTFTISNNTSNNVTQLFPVINENETQQALYHRSLDGTYGMIDQNDNWYAVYELQAGTSREINIEATVKKSEAEYRVKDPIKDLPWPSNEYTEEIDKLVELEPVLQNKIEAVYQYLRNKKTLSDQDDTNYNSNDDYWEYLVEKESYTSFDYCYILSAFALQNNVKAQMEYGYELIASNFFPKKVPQFWCTFEYPDGQIEQFDFVTHDVYGFDLHTLGTSVTKLSYGFWTPDSPVKDPLGLLVEDEYILNMEFISDEEYSAQGGAIKISPGSFVKATSGFFHNVRLSVTNDSESLAPITDFKYEGRSYKSSFNWGGYKLALLPKQVNNLEFKNIRIENFLFKGFRQVEIDISLDNEQSKVASTSIVAEYQLDVRLVIGFISVLSLLLFLVLMVIWFVFIKRRNKQYIRRGMY